MYILIQVPVPACVTIMCRSYVYTHTSTCSGMCYYYVSVMCIYSYKYLFRHVYPHVLLLCVGHMYILRLVYCFLSTLFDKLLFTINIVDYFVLSL